MKSIEKLRESSHLDDNKWTFETGEVVRMYGTEPSDQNAVNWGERWREIADEIEAEIERDYMRLPVDADGVPIRHGDTIAHAGLSIGPIDVISIGAEGDWIVGHDGNTWELTGDEVHINPRTLEDVLEDYVVEYQTRHARSEFGAEHFDHVDVHEMVKRCADEIRELLGSDGEC